MNTKTKRITRILAASIATLLTANSAHSVSDTWTGAFDGDFTNPLNWLGGNVPGVPGTTPGSTDIATFNNGVNTTIALNGNRNLQSLVFDNRHPGLSGFALGGSALTLTAASSVYVLGGWGAANQTINSNLTITRNAGANDWIVATAAGYGGSLSFGGAIAPGTLAATTQLSLRGGFGSTVAFNGGLNNNGTGLLQLNVANSTTAA